VIYKITNFLNATLALHSSRQKKAMVGNNFQIGEDLQCREAQTHVSIFSFFDPDYLLQLFLYVAKVYLLLIECFMDWHSLLVISTV